MTVVFDLPKRRIRWLPMSVAACSTSKAFDRLLGIESSGIRQLPRIISITAHVLPCCESVSVINQSVVHTRHWLWQHLSVKAVGMEETLRVCSVPVGHGPCEDTELHITRVTFNGCALLVCNLNNELGRAAVRWMFDWWKVKMMHTVLRLTTDRELLRLLSVVY